MIIGKHVAVWVHLYLQDLLLFPVSTEHPPHSANPSIKESKKDQADASSGKSTDRGGTPRLEEQAVTSREVKIGKHHRHPAVRTGAH